MNCWAWAKGRWPPVIFPQLKISYRMYFGTISSELPPDVPMGWKNRYHMLERQAWTKESLILYSAHNSPHIARLSKDYWLLVQKVTHLLKEVATAKHAVHVFPTWYLLCKIYHSVSEKMLKLIYMQQKHAVKKRCLPPLHLQEFIHLRLNEIKEIGYESWARKNMAIKDIIGGNWLNLNMDFGPRLWSNPM